MPRRRADRAARRAAPLAAAPLLALAACATPGVTTADDPPARGSAGGGDRFARANAILGADAVGLETHWWITADDDQRIARALAPFAEEPLDADPAALERWRRDGFLVLAVPIDRLTELQRRTPPRSDWRRRWLGVTTRWEPAIEARRLTAEQRVLFGARPANPGPGTPRLLARAWTEPVPPDAAALRLELALQLRSADAETALSLDAPTSLADEADRGPLFEGLTLSAALPPTHALVVAPLDPAINLDDLLADDPDPATAAAAPPAPADPQAGTTDDPIARLDELIDRLEQNTPGADADAPIGPSTAQPRTLGQTALTLESADGTPLAALLVFLPRLPDTFTLLPAPR
jgi:hypothetical protein